MLIRRAGRRDLESIQRLWLQLRESSAKADPRLSLASGAERLAEDHREVILADPRTGLFVAEERGEIVGFLHGQIDTNDATHRVERYGNIVDLYVEPGRRRQGVGQQLVEYCREWFESQNVPEFRIESPVSNPATASFLKTLGGEALSVLHVIPLDRRSGDSSD